MRAALEKIIQLYKTSPVFQDLMETSAGTALVAVGQTAMTDMTPEEIALSSAAAFGGGIVGRPIMGRVGQAVGGFIDRRAPQVGDEILVGMEQVGNMLPEPVRQMREAKLNPYRHLGGAAQYGNLLGRGYGDNALQGVIGLASPVIFGGPADEQQPGQLPM